MSDKLKPCPFCGGEAYIERVGSQKESRITQCKDCSCWLESNESNTTVNLTWNTRTGAAEIEELIMVTDWGIDHLQRRADLDHAGIAQGGGREWSRALWGAFTEYEKIASKFRAESDVKAKRLRKEARSDEAFLASENQIADKDAEVKRLREALEYISLCIPESTEYEINELEHMINSMLGIARAALKGDQL